MYFESLDLLRFSDWVVRRVFPLFFSITLLFLCSTFATSNIPNTQRECLIFIALQLHKAIRLPNVGISWKFRDQIFITLSFHSVFRASTHTSSLSRLHLWYLVGGYYQVMLSFWWIFTFYCWCEANDNPTHLSSRPVMASHHKLPASKYHHPQHWWPRSHIQNDTKVPLDCPELLTSRDWLCDQIGIASVADGNINFPSWISFTLEACLLVSRIQCTNSPLLAYLSMVSQAPITFSLRAKLWSSGCLWEYHKNWT